MATRQFSLSSIFAAIFWIAGALALGRLAWNPELGGVGHRFAVCVLGAWVGAAIGGPLRHPGLCAFIGVCAGVLYSLFVLDRFP